MNYVPLKCKTHYSLQESLIKPDKLADHLEKLNIGACALTDIGSISGAVEFSSALQKKKIKPILGTEVIIKDRGTVVLIAKNKKGWSNLIKLTSESNNKENLIDRYGRDTPTLNLSSLSKYDNLICIVGHHGTILDTDDEAIALATINFLKDCFGTENVFIEISNISLYNKNEFLRDIAKKAQVLTVASCDAHYLEMDSFVDHKLLLTSLLKQTIAKLNVKEIGELSPYFHSNMYHLPSYQEMITFNTEEEIKNTLLISSMCEEYKITGKPRTPKFDCPDNLSEAQYLHRLAQEGYKRCFKENWDKEIYGERAKKELAVIEKAGLEGYFLIVQDYVNWARQRMLIGPARGSSCGSLVSFFTNITTVDPIPHDLIFERFYNEGRNTADHISFPDIDVDFPLARREEVIEYVRNKYGRDKVSHMVTFGRMLGRGALKEVLRIHDACDANTMNQITKDLPHEHEILDKLEDSGEESIIKWTLENDPDSIKEYAKLEDGVITGDYAEYFGQAIRLEGTYRSQGKHAAGIVISADVLAEVCPMVSDKSSDEKIAGMEMESIEKLGYLKMDFLSLAALDKLSLANELLGGK
jgi:DNA polymerase-3 subunit alpha